ncbi:MAG: Fic family protein [Candidatus Woesearchaeota archaeon]
MHVKKRGSYFYLQHSFRLNGKIVTREKYLGKSLPSDLRIYEKALLAEMFSEALKGKLDKIEKEFQKEYKRLSASEKERYLNDLIIRFTYNTNAIEGSKITLPETNELLREGLSPAKPFRDVHETIAHANLLKSILLLPQRPTEKIILNWHKELFTQTKHDIAGKYRTLLVRVGSYLAPDWQDVPKLMNKMFSWFVRADEHPLLVAARLHYRFEKIHPFADGNGRVGRLLLASALWNAGVPLLVIEFSKRKSYYRALQSSEERFVQYVVRRYLKEHADYLKE